MPFRIRFVLNRDMIYFTIIRLCSLTLFYLFSIGLVSFSFSCYSSRRVFFYFFLAMYFLEVTKALTQSHYQFKKSLENKLLWTLQYWREYRTSCL
jgi:peptidoglycan biosynthesis protein MviN/MurJ (putative lipid II flippase)